MPKQLNVNLAFTADTHEAKAQLASLQQDLNKLTQTVGSKSPLGITKDLSSAIGEVNKLQVALKNATTDSGKLDLGQFRKELGTANLDARKIAETLNGLGPEGQAAFAKLAQSVTLAEVPIKKVNNTLSQFATTLANTARWQISSSVLHGFIGALQSAYRYAQDLNNSLNSIRIVTGQSTDQMAQFAKQANESAKALSATTTAYTDASLIFFQQGLTGEAVTERTDAVIKMSNVTGDSVEDVASYMTAIWNNFDDGSQSLEHFADVITALGAATASSSAEISAGLEKFASIADTVGLSYDYATSALATVVATTRQSADTVGTAFKTLFARIQGLKLGETLDDGVTLNKYSEALNAVGVQVLDLSGNMRNLDDILDDLAERWKFLSSAQQTALAQTVAGTRQYNQLVALMNNWDFMEENLEVARNAEGSLQEQADIYAESWEAASKRVKAAWQEIYGQLLDDKFFINLTNGFGKVLDEISNVIDAFGGLKGIVPLLGTSLLSLFGKQLSDSLNNFIYNLQLAHGGMEAIVKERQAFNQELVDAKINTADLDIAGLGVLYQKQGEVQNELIKKTVELQQQGKNLTSQEEELLKIYLDQNNALIEQYDNQTKVLNAAREKQTTAELQVFQSSNSDLYGGNTYLADLEEASNDTKVISAFGQLGAKAIAAFEGNIKEADIEDTLRPIEEAFENAFTAEGVQGFSEELRNNFHEALKEGKSGVLDFIDSLKRNSITLDDIIDQIQGTDEASKRLKKNLENYRNSIQETTEKILAQASAQNSANKSMEKTSEIVKSLQGNIATFADKFIAGTRAVSTFGMTLSSITGLIDTWTNPDTSGIDKFIASLTTLGMVIPMLNSAIKSLNTNLGINLLAIQSNTAAVGAYIKIKQGKIATVYEDIAAEKISNLAASEQIEKLAARVLGEEALIGAKEKGITVDSIKLALEQKSIKLSAINLGALIKRILGEEALNEELKKQIVLETILKGIAGFGIAGAAAIIAGAVAVVKIYNKHLENVAEKTKETAESHKKLTDEIKQETNNFSELANKYKELSEQEAAGKITQTELQTEVAKLSEEYDNQRTAILNLAGAYGQLDNAIEKYREEYYQDLYNSSSKDVKNFTDSLKTQIEANNSTAVDSGMLDLVKGIKPDFNDLKFLSDLTSAYGIDIDDITGKINFDQFIDALIQDQKGIEQLIQENSDSEAASNLLKIINQNSEILDQLNESVQNVKESALNLAFNQNFDKDNFNIIDLIRNIEEDERIQRAKITDEEVADFVAKEISGIDEVAKYGQALEIALVFYDKDEVKDQLDTLADQIADFNDSDKAIITLFPTLAQDFLNKDTGHFDLEGFRERFSDLESYYDEKGKYFQAGNYINEYANQGTFSDLAGISELLGKDTAKMSTEEILVELQKLYNQSLELANNYVQNAIENLDEFKEEIALNPSQEDIDKFWNLDQRQKFLENYNASDQVAVLQLEQEVGADLVTLTGASSELVENFEQFYQQYKDFIDSEEEAPEDLKKTLSLYKQVFGEEFINSVLRSRDGLIGNEEALKEYERALESVKELTIDYKDRCQDLLGIIKNLNKSIDNLQSAYKTVAAAEKEYNEKGYYSVDTVQSLLDLGPEYLKYLDITGNKISMDTNAVKAQQDAYYDLLEVQYAEYYQNQMSIILEAQKTKETNNATVALYTQKIVQDNLNGSLLEFIADCSAAAKGTGIYADALNGLAETAQKTYEILTLGRQSLDNVDFEGVMNATPKGSSGSTDRKDIKDYIKEFDRLYSIKKALEDIADAISDLDKKKSHLVGKSLSEVLKKENELLAEQRDLYLDLIKQQSDYRDELAGSLEQFGATFDYSTGNLTNYLEITQAALDKYNAAVDAYNSSHDKGAFSIAEQEYNHFKEVLSAYQSILTDMQETQNNLDDNFLQQIENNLAGFEAEIKVDLDIDEAERKVNDFFKNITTNFKKMYKSTEDWAKIFTTASKNAATYTQGSTSTLETDLKALQEIKDFIDNEGWNSDDPNRLFVSRDDAITKYQELSDQLMEDAQDLYDLYEDTWENYLNAIDEVKSQWDDILKGFDKVDNTLKHYEKIATLLYGGDDTAGGRNYLEQIYNAQQSNSLARQNALRQQIDAWQKEYDELIAAGADKNDKDLKAIQENIEDSEKNLESEIENYLTIIQNRLTNAIKSIMDTANRSMTKGYGIDTVIERWNDAQEAAEGYYDEVERVYELETMESKWEEAISKTSSLKNQQYLTSLMNEQLKNLKEKTKLSEYDIGLAEKQLAVYQAQVALEEARENKNAMKLVRNEQGNWAYQYVADEEDIANKEEDLRNKTYEEYEYVKNASIEATEKVLELYQTAQERLSALMEEYKYADEARREEIKAEYDYLYEYYYGEDGLIVTKAKETQGMEYDLNLAGMKLLWELYEEDEKNYDAMTEIEKTLIDNLRDHGITSYTQLITEVATGDNSLYRQLETVCQEVTNDNRTQWEMLAKGIIGDWATNPDSVRNTISQVYDDIMLKVLEYDIAIETSEQVAGYAWTDIKERTEEAERAVYAVEQAIWSLVSTTDDLSNFAETVRMIGGAFDDIYGRIANAVNAAQTFLRLFGQVSDVNIPQVNLPLNPTGKGWTPTTGDNGGSGGGPRDTGITTTETRYRLVGHDNYGHANANILTQGTNESYEDFIARIENTFGNDNGEMGYYYSHMGSSDNAKVGNWRLDSISSSQQIPSIDTSAINRLATQTLMSALVQDVQNGMWAATNQVTSLNQTVPSTNVINNTTTNDTGNRLSIGTFNAYAETIDEEFMTKSIFDYIGRDNN